MTKLVLAVFTICALALSACGATTPVPAGCYTIDPGSNSPNCNS